MPWSTAASSSGDGQLRVMGLRVRIVVHPIRNWGLGGKSECPRAACTSGSKAAGHFFNVVEDGAPETANSIAAAVAHEITATASPI